MDDIELVKQRIDIVDLLSNYIQLKKAGRNFKALCPFHTEKSPSFVVSPERQIWHCFGCSKGGDIFTFIEEYEKADFSESLKILAERAGVKLSAPVYKTKQEEKKALIYNLNALTAQFYHYLLTEHTVGKHALDYLTQQRKIPLPLIKKLQLGFAPENNTALYRYLLKKKGYKEQDLLDAGLISREKSGRLSDFFRNRIIFPIQDIRGNYIAFSGRALTDAVMPKYINTRETDAYKKSESLYGIYFAKDAIRTENKVLLVEGEFDVISAFKEGIQYAVAVKGTALTEEQIKLLKRYVEKILICFDTDPAGTAAQKRSISLIEKEGLLASVILPPEGKDPDELLRENPGLFKQALKKSIHIYDFIISSALTQNTPNTVEGKRAILENTLPFLSVIQNEVVKEHYLKKLAESLHTSLESIRTEAEKMKKPTPSIKRAEKKEEKISREEMVEKYLLSLLLQYQHPKEILSSLDPTLLDSLFSIPAIHRIVKQLTTYAANQDTISIEVFAKTLPTELLPMFDTSFLAPIPHFASTEEYKKEIETKIQETKTNTIRKKLKELNEKIKEKEQAGDDETLQKLQTTYDTLTKLLQEDSYQSLVE